MKRYYLFIFSILFFAINSYAKTNLDDNSTAVLLPVNETKGLFASLQVPENFVMGHSDQQEIKPGIRQLIMEFIPKGEAITNWSEIITAQSFVGHGIQARAFIDQSLNIMKQTLGSNMSEPQILYAERDDYEEGSLRISYTLQGTEEVLLIRVFSGPYDTAVVQMTYRPTRIAKYDGDKLESDFKDSVKVISIDSLPEDLKKELSSGK